MPIADKEPILLKFDRFRELFALLDFEKSNSQNDPIYIFCVSKNPDRTQISSNKILLSITGAGGRGEALRYSTSFEFATYLLIFH